MCGQFNYSGIGHGEKYMAGEQLAEPFPITPRGNVSIPLETISSPINGSSVTSDRNYELRMNTYVYVRTHVSPLKRAKCAE